MSDLLNFRWSGFRGYRSVDLVAVVPNFSHGRFDAVLPLVISVKSTQEGELPPEPTVRLSHESAKNLMDELWACGVRPTGKSDPGGEVQALRDHLDDMRLLVAHHSGATLRTAKL